MGDKMDYTIAIDERESANKGNNWWKWCFEGDTSKGLLIMGNLIYILELF